MFVSLTMNFRINLDDYILLDFSYNLNSRMEEINELFVEFSKRMFFERGEEVPNANKKSCAIYSHSP